MIPVATKRLGIHDILNEHLQKMQIAEAFAKEHTYGQAIKASRKLADGKHLVIYDPAHSQRNGDGVIVETVVMALRRDNEVRFIVDTNFGTYYTINGNVAKFEGFLSDKTLNPGLLAAEGTEFRGWKKTRQYKLTRDEIDRLIHGMVFCT